MAGRRRKTGKQTRAANRLASWHERIAQAATPEELYDVATDWFRASVSRVKDPAARARLLTDAAQHVASLADRIARQVQG